MNRIFIGRSIGLALENLERPKLGPLATEERVMPELKDYPDGLAQYQRIRVNRLIMEAIIQDRQILNDSAYLSTQGVIQAALTEIPWVFVGQDSGGCASCAFTTL